MFIIALHSIRNFELFLIILPFFSIGVGYSNNEFAPLGANSFLLSVDPFSEALSCPRRQTGDLKLFPNVKIAEKHGVYLYTLKKCR